MVGNLLYKKWMVQIMSCTMEKEEKKTFSNFCKFQFFLSRVMKCEIFCQFTLEVGLQVKCGSVGVKEVLPEKRTTMSQDDIDKNIFLLLFLDDIEHKVLDEFLMHYACSNMLVSDLGKSPLHFACTLSNIQATLSPLAICFQPETTILQLGCP